MSTILAKLGGLTLKKYPREIAGTEFQFYPVRVKNIVTGTTREILQPLSDALQVMLRPRNADEEVLEEISPDGTVGRARKPVTKEMAVFRAEQRHEALSAAMSAILRDDTRYKLARLIMDSLRDDCPKNPSEQEIKDFADADEMDVVVFTEFLKGFMAANAALFGDLGNVIRERINQAVERMTADPEEVLEDAAPDQPQETEAPTLRPLHDEGEVRPT